MGLASSAALFLDAGSVPKPDEVLFADGIERWAAGKRRIGNPFDGGRIEPGAAPPVNLGMAIGKREATSSIMIRGRGIAPRAQVTSGVQIVTIVDAVRVLVQSHEDLSRCRDL